MIQITIRWPGFSWIRPAMERHDPIYLVQTPGSVTRPVPHVFLSRNATSFEMGFQGLMPD